jgi:hypothetical protein
MKDGLISVIHEFLKKQGPSTGAEIRDACAEDTYPVWRLCRQAGDLHSEIVGRRYLRLDRRVEGYGRLSPSIMREFLTYTVIGLSGTEPAIRERAEALDAKTKKTSQEKFALAREKIGEILDASRVREAALEKVCFIIAGDIIFDMAHTVPRPERSTGKLVNGSDLDVIVVCDERFSAGETEILDQEIYKAKYRLLIDPDLKEELDYIVKDMNRVAAQLRFDNFRHMVASKLLDEGVFLHGSRPLFDRIKKLVQEQGVPEKIRGISEHAIQERRRAEAYLLSCEEGISEEEYQPLFYTADEADEIY